MKGEHRMKGALCSCLSILQAWKNGRITVTKDKDDALNHQYSINTLMSVIECNLLEGIYEPTEIIKRGSGKYEILITISRV